ncbi:MAG: CpXC domain-containing protein [Clostridia bacterium]|nr:CpXC domain-containing protein [Clostridia bacterium]
MAESQNNIFTCPQCGEDGPLTMWTSINVAQDPDARRRVEDLSVFEWTCPNCNKTSLVLHPCLYHDVANEFMIWFAPDGEIQDKTTDFSQLNHYTLRTTHTPNEFREKVNVLERHLDDRALEMTKLILIMQLTRDNVDVVDVVFHSIDTSGRFVFVLVHPDGAEQYLRLPPTTYQKLAHDVREYLYTPSNGFLTIDLNWAKESLEMLKDIN